MDHEDFLDHSVAYLLENKTPPVSLVIRMVRVEVRRLSRPVAVFELLPAAAIALIISSPYSLLLLTHPLHHFSRSMTSSYLLRHKLHCKIDMLKEMLVPCTEIVQAVITVGRFDESVFGALATASEFYGTLAAILR